MEIEYDYQKQATKSLQLDDFTNVAIRATSAEGTEYYLMTSTLMGETEIFTFGPIIADSISLLNEFTLKYKKIKYNGMKIIKEFENLLNGRIQMSNAEIISTDELSSALPDFKQIFLSKDLKGIAAIERENALID